MEKLGGRYRLEEPCGTGGMAVVWRAYDDVLGREVAVKLLAPKLAADPVARERIYAEARAAGGLAHPNITSVFDYGVSSGPDGQDVPFVVMELLDGQTLAARLRSGALRWHRALSVCADIAAALASAHAAGVIHRDVKPANVMLTSRGVKVLDFGIAAAVGAPDDSGPEEPFLGTLAYVAPERLLGEPAVPATDVYALGLITYRCLSAAYPWEPASTEELISQHCFVAPAPLPPIPGLPAPIEELITRCLAKDPAERPLSVEVARVFGAAAGHRVVLPGEPTGSLTDVVPRLAPAGVPGLAVPGQAAGVAGDDATGDGDDVKPRSPVPLPAGPPGPVPHRSRWARLAAAGLGTAGVLAFAVTCGARTPEVPAAGAGDRTPVPTPAPTAKPAALACAIAYRTESAAAAATVTVTNTGTRDFANLILVVGLADPAGPAAGDASVRTQLNARVGGQLRAGRSIKFRLRSTFLATQRPDGFTLNGVPCPASSTASMDRTTAPWVTVPPAETAVPSTPGVVGGDPGPRPDPGTGTETDPPPVTTTRPALTAVVTPPATSATPDRTRAAPTKTKRTKCPTMPPNAPAVPGCGNGSVAD